jgi:hypothetical protein
MADVDVAISSRSQLLVAAARVLCGRSRLGREMATGIRRHAQALRGRIAAKARARFERVSHGTVAGIGVRVDRRRHSRRAHARLLRPGRRISDRPPADADHQRVLLAGADEAWRLLTVIAVTPLGQRGLKRRLLELQELAYSYTLDAERQAALRHHIDRMQVAILTANDRYIDGVNSDDYREGDTERNRVGGLHVRTEDQGSFARTSTLC